MVGSSLKRLKKIINGRPVVIMLHGKSIGEMEKEIVNLKNINVCYASINYFGLLEKHLLSRINKNFDIVLDCSTVSDQLNFDVRNRLPRLSKFMDRKENNIWLTTRGMLQNLFIKSFLEEFIYKFYKKILLVENIGIHSRELEIRNSFFILYYSCIIGDASKIAICGMDGYDGKEENVLDSYYKKDEYMKIRLASKGKIEGNLKIDSENIKETEKTCLENFKKKTKNKIPPTINFSKYSIFDIFEKREYKQLKNWLQE